MAFQTPKKGTQQQKRRSRKTDTQNRAKAVDLVRSLKIVFVQVSVVIIPYLKVSYIIFDKKINN